MKKNTKHDKHVLTFTPTDSIQVAVDAYVQWMNLKAAVN